MERKFFSNTRYDRLTAGIRRKSLAMLDEFGLCFPVDWQNWGDLEWLVAAKDLIEKEISRYK